MCEDSCRREQSQTEVTLSNSLTILCKYARSECILYQYRLQVVMICVTRVIVCPTVFHLYDRIVLRVISIRRNEVHVLLASLVFAEQHHTGICRNVINLIELNLTSAKFLAILRSCTEIVCYIDMNTCISRSHICTITECAQYISLTILCRHLWNNNGEVVLTINSIVI